MECTPLALVRGVGDQELVLGVKKNIFFDWRFATIAKRISRHSSGQSFLPSLLVPTMRNKFLRGCTLAQCQCNCSNSRLSVRCNVNG